MATALWLLVIAGAGAFPIALLIASCTLRLRRSSISSCLSSSGSSGSSVGVNGPVVGRPLAWVTGRFDGAGGTGGSGGAGRGFFRLVFFLRSAAMVSMFTDSM